MFAKDRANIQALQKTHKAMTSLLKKFQEDCFDEEDRRLVALGIQEIEAAQEKAAQILQGKEKIYQTYVRGLETRIQARQKILEACSQDLEAFPVGLEFLARKQAELQQVVTTVKGRLEES